MFSVLLAAVFLSFGYRQQTFLGACFCLYLMAFLDYRLAPNLGCMSQKENPVGLTTDSPQLMMVQLRIFRLYYGVKVRRISVETIL